MGQKAHEITNLGDSGPALASLAKMFNDPIQFNVLPYKNDYTRDGKIQYTGFFIPAHEFALKPEFLDSRGVTDKIRFREHYEKQRALMNGSTLMTYCAEHCFTPDEALSNRLNHCFEKTNREFNADINETDEFLSKHGKN